MAEYVPGSSQLVFLAAQYLEFERNFGPFRPIDRTEAALADPQLVWTGTAAGDHQLQNGFLESKDAYVYVLASKKCTLPLNSLAFKIVCWFDCPDCDATELQPEGCEKCEWSGSFAIDLGQITSDGSLDFFSEEQIWTQRIPGSAF